MQRTIRVVAVDNGPWIHSLRNGVWSSTVGRTVSVIDLPIPHYPPGRPWLVRGDCRESIFNLKPPMKKRYAEVRRCQALIAEELAGVPYRLALKQLYHNREEVTGHLRRI